MAKHNKNTQANNNNNSNCNTTPVSTPVQEDTMTQAQATVNSIQDLLNSAKIEAKNAKKAGTLKLKAYQVAVKSMNKEIEEEENALFFVLKNNTVDDITKLQLKQATELKVAQIKLAHKPSIDALKFDFEEASSAIASVGGEKLGAGIAKVSKPVGSFLGSMSERAGIKMPWSK